MLRITQEGDAGKPSLRLEGRLEGAWVEVLRRVWEELASSLSGLTVTVDLGAVSFADRAGRVLLLGMREKGAVLTNVSGFMQQILADSDDSD